ncbi:PREDICTED: unconventional myosin-Ie-like, partial [Amphimedon queenslandica]|uniref:TH1 domain-containing protein n=1 Tax=Amphimedon queenslandica TaxID=400682 RepID=A0AAN0JX26_AMPQE
MSPLQNDFFVIHVANDFDSVLESVLKTEFLTLLSEKYKHLTQNQLKFQFNNNITVTLKKEEFDWRGGNTRTMQFHQAGGDNPVLKLSGKTLQVSIGPELPSSTRPSHQRLPATKGGKRPGLAAPSYQQQSRGPQQNL